MNEQVVIGKLKDPHTISGAMSAKTIQTWDHRAMWSYLRLQYLKTKADRMIHQHFDVLETAANRKFTKAERRAEMKLLFADLVRDQVKPKKMQFIFDEEQRVMAVASLKHLLIPPSQIYDMATKILSVNYGQPQQMQIGHLQGLSYQVKEVQGFKLGIQVYGGSITTRQAIVITSWLRVERCLNALSWLGMGSLNSFGLGISNYERVLRIKVRAELEPRIRQGIEQALGKVQAIEDRIPIVQKRRLRRKDARIITTAFGLSYHLGAKSIIQILDRLEKEPKTQWGLSMAASWVASHGKFKKTPSKVERSVEQGISTIAGATMLLDDLKTVRNRSLEWLKSHVESGKVKSIKELIEDVI